MAAMSGPSTGSMAMPSTAHTGMNPIFMGVMCGVMHAVGPDHLATLITFSTLMEPLQAARVGAAWGLGHSIGIIGVAFLVLCLGRLPWIHLSAWEYIGDYIIGASVIAAAIYFIIKEDYYLEMSDDGSIVVRGCACHGSIKHDSRLPHAHDEVKSKKKGKFCSDYSSSGTSSEEDLQVNSKKKTTFCGDYSSGASSEEDADAEVGERTPMLAATAEKQRTGRDVQSGLVGLLQGMCCPMGLVGMGYLAGRSPVDIFIFILVSVAVSIIGTGSIACVWAYLTRSKIASEVNPRFIYRGSCAIALCFGTAWIVANYVGVLDQVNYAE